MLTDIKTSIDNGLYKTDITYVIALGPANAFFKIVFDKQRRHEYNFKVRL